MIVVAMAVVGTVVAYLFFLFLIVYVVIFIFVGFTYHPTLSKSIEAFWLSNSEKEELNVRAKKEEEQFFEWADADDKLKELISQAEERNLSRNQDGSISRRSQLGKDIASQEKRVDYYSELLDERKRELDEISSLPFNRWWEEVEKVMTKQRAWARVRAGLYTLAVYILATWFVSTKVSFTAFPFDAIFQAGQTLAKSTFTHLGIQVYGSTNLYFKVGEASYPLYPYSNWIASMLLTAIPTYLFFKKVRSSQDDNIYEHATHPFVEEPDKVTIKNMNDHGKYVPDYKEQRRLQRQQQEVTALDGTS